jgi:hypothetical protein
MATITSTVFCLGVKRFTDIQVKDNDRIDFDFNITDSEWTLFKKIIDNKQLKPVQDIVSHKQVYTLLLIHDKIIGGYKIDSLNDFTQDAQWVKLMSPEYLYLIYRLAPTYVDYKTFFLTVEKPFSHVATTMGLIDVVADSKLQLEIAKFYGEFSIKSLFDSYNDAVESHIKNIKRSLAEVFDYLLISPYGLPMTYQNSTDKVWPATSIDNVKPRVVGQNVMCNYNTFIDRFHKYTCGLIKKSINPGLIDKQFPWGDKNCGAVISGSAALMMIEANETITPRSDIDIFIYGRNPVDRVKLFDDLLKWFYLPGKTFYSTEGGTGAVKSVYIVDVPRKFQIVNTSYIHPYQIINRFDLSHIQWLVLDCKQFNIQKMTNGIHPFGTHFAIQAIRTQTSEYRNPRNVKTERIVKTMIQGYDLAYDEYINNDVLNIDHFLSDDNKSSIQQIKQDIHKWFLPVSIAGLDQNMFNDHVRGMIIATSKASDVATELKTAMKNISAGSSFIEGYEASTCTNFSGDRVYIRGGIVQWKMTYDIMDRNGKITLTSNELVVKEVVTGDGGITVTLATDTIFKSFVEILETNVFRLFSNRNLTKHIINSNEIKLNVTDAQCQRQMKDIKPLLRDKLGKCLSLSEDLNKDDKVQFVFTMTASLADVRCINLIPMRFIKCNPRNFTPDYLAAVTPVVVPAFAVASTITAVAMPNDDASIEYTGDVAYD